jgi:hypothetical protein
MSVAVLRLARLTSAAGASLAMAAPRHVLRPDRGSGQGSQFLSEGACAWLRVPVRATGRRGHLPALSGIENVAANGPSNDGAANQNKTATPRRSGAGAIGWR